jgi:hypothetical protein
MPTNTEIVQAGYAAFARQDIPAVLGLLDDNIEWYIPDELPEGGLYRGPDGVLEFFGRLMATYTEIRVEPDRFLGADEGRVIVEGHHRGRLGETTFEVGFVHIWTLRDGCAVAYREYADSGKLLLLLQAAAPAH